MENLLCAVDQFNCNCGRKEALYRAAQNVAARKNLAHWRGAGLWTAELLTSLGECSIEAKARKSNGEAQEDSHPCLDWLQCALLGGLSGEEMLQKFSVALPIIQTIARPSDRDQCTALVSKAIQSLAEESNLPQDTASLLLELHCDCHVPVALPTIFARTLIDWLCQPSLLQDPTNEKRDLHYALAICGMMEAIWNTRPETVLTSLAQLFYHLQAPQAPSAAVQLALAKMPLQTLSNSVTAVIATVTDQDLLPVARRMVLWACCPLSDLTGSIVLGLLEELQGSRPQLFARLASATLGPLLEAAVCGGNAPTALSVAMCLADNYQGGPGLLLQAWPSVCAVGTAAMAEALPNDDVSAFIAWVRRQCRLQCRYTELTVRLKTLLATLGHFLDGRGAIAWHSQNMSVSECRDRHRAEGGWTGLMNMGNTCYYNAVVQALFMTVPFRTAVLAHNCPLCQRHGRDCAVGALQRLFVFLALSTQKAISPASALAPTIPDWFQPGAQHDADELLKYLLCLTAVPPQIRVPERVSASGGDTDVRQDVGMEASAQQGCESGPDVPCPFSTAAVTCQPMNCAEKASDVFTGTILSKVLCSVCGTQTCVAEEFNDIALPLPTWPAAGATPPYGSPALSQLLAAHIASEPLTGTEQFDCAVCSAKTDAQRSLTFQRLPPCLVVTLKRFGTDPVLHTTHKVDLAVDGLMELQLEQVGEEAGVQTVAYWLHALVCHKGNSLEGGHYYSLARDMFSTPSIDSAEGPWYIFDDDEVRAVSFADMTRRFSNNASNTPYLLFYSQRRPASSYPLVTRQCLIEEVTRENVHRATFTPDQSWPRLSTQQSGQGGGSGTLGRPTGGLDGSLPRFVM